MLGSSEGTPDVLDKVNLKELLRALYHVGDKVQDLVLVSAKLIESQTEINRRLSRHADALDLHDEAMVRCMNCRNYEPAEEVTITPSGLHKKLG